MNLCACGCGGFTKRLFRRGHQWASKRVAADPPNPSGLCKCGCGEKTKIAEITDLKRGVVRGFPINYVMGHQSRRKRGPKGVYRKTLAKPLPNPSGLCMCGCGETTSLARETNNCEGTVMGQHVRYIRGHGLRPETPQYIEEDRGYRTPCWIWQWHRDNAGYGRIMRNGRSMGAHRWYYSQSKGEIPKGIHLDHRCFVPACVNPDHLEAVTPRVNNDRRRSVKLSPEKAPVIRQLHEWGASIKDIAKIFGVTAQTIWKVCAGDSWEPRSEY